MVIVSIAFLIWGFISENQCENQTTCAVFGGICYFSLGLFAGVIQYIPPAVMLHIPYIMCISVCF